MTEITQTLVMMGEALGRKLDRIGDQLERMNNINEQNLQLTEQALSPKQEYVVGPSRSYPSNIDQS